MLYYYKWLYKTTVRHKHRALLESDSWNISLCECTKIVTGMECRGII